jgi:hypothetical protein
MVVNTSSRLVAGYFDKGGRSTRIRRETSFHESVTSHQETKIPSATTNAPRTISNIFLTRNAELICGLPRFQHVHNITDLSKPLADTSGRAGVVRSVLWRERNCRTSRTARQRFTDVPKRFIFEIDIGKWRSAGVPNAKAFCFFLTAHGGGKRSATGRARPRLRVLAALLQRPRRPAIDR